MLPAEAQKVKLSDSFTLYDLLRSDTAERSSALMDAQFNPPQSVVDCLGYLAKTTLQPLVDKFNYPLRVSSGYRSTAVNQLVGGVSSSQHCFGQAADISVADDFLTDPDSEAVRQYIEANVLKVTGKPVDPETVNANFYLFAFVCMNLDTFDIDQVIHEFGVDYGQPAWVHVASSSTQNKRQIVVLGKYVDAGDTHIIDFETALGFGN